jgi:hypothetical protein
MLQSESAVLVLILTSHSITTRHIDRTYSLHLQGRGVTKTSSQSEDGGTQNYDFNLRIRDKKMLCTFSDVTDVRRSAFDLIKKVNLSP